jgi:hypothetical protein
MTGRLIFTIGAAAHGDSYEVTNAPDDWVLAGQTPMCGACGQVLHLVFDSPPKNGTAICGCASLGNSEFRVFDGGGPQQ